MADEELLDLVDDEDRVIGQQTRQQIYAFGMTCFRVVNAFVQNDDGKLWIPRRAPGKQLFPNALDVSVGGHVRSGESYDEAFFRETLEETRVNTNKVSWERWGALTPHAHGVSAFMQVYAIHLDAVPDFNRQDFSEWFWLSPEEALSRIAQGDSAKGDLSRLLRYFFN